MRWWNELKYFWTQVRCGYERQCMEEEHRLRKFYIIRMKLAPYTYEQCLLAAYEFQKLPRAYYGEMVGLLLNRVGRGNITLAEVKVSYDRLIS